VFAHSGKHDETLVPGNNVSTTMFPSLPRALEIEIARTSAEFVIYHA
jgi:hypothetical protein